jgi:hypothetical protein
VSAFDLQTETGTASAIEKTSEFASWSASGFGTNLKTGSKTVTGYPTASGLGFWSAFASDSQTETGTASATAKMSASESCSASGSVKNFETGLESETG